MTPQSHLHTTVCGWEDKVSPHYYLAQQAEEVEHGVFLKFGECMSCGSPPQRGGAQVEWIKGETVLKQGSAKYGHILCLLSCVLMWQRTGSSVIRGRLPFMRAPPNPPQVPPPDTTALGLYFNTRILWGHKPLTYGSVTSTAVYVLRGGSREPRFKGQRNQCHF